MPTIKLTKAEIDRLPLPAAGQRAAYQDRDTPGLQLRVTCKGVRTFCVFKRVAGGGPERVTLGRYPDMTIEQARRQALKILAAIADGANPAEVKRAHRREMTFADLFREYLERHAKPRKRTWQEDEQRFRQYLERPLGARKLSVITRQHIAQLHASITAAGHGTVANRVLALVSSVYGRGQSWGLVEANPAKGIERNRETSRDRFLQARELPRFFAALAAEPSDTIRDYVLLSLLTGARRGNVLAMRWRELELDEALWRIPLTKNGTPQLVPLSHEAIQILRERRERAARGVEYVFPGSGKEGHLVEPKKGWDRILDRAGALGFVRALGEAAGWSAEQIVAAEQDALADPAAAARRHAGLAERLGVRLLDHELADLRIHDLRRTLGSWQAKSGASLAIIGKSLNHKSQLTTAIYARLDVDPVRQSVEKATAAMLAAGGLKASAEVKTLQQAA